MAKTDDWIQYWKENPNSKVLFTGDDGKSIEDFEKFWSQNFWSRSEPGL